MSALVQRSLGEKSAKSDDEITLGINMTFEGLDLRY